ncbi:MAG: alpha-L-fucosidase [Oscillospiraceae bacterium]
MGRAVCGGGGEVRGSGGGAPRRLSDVQSDVSHWNACEMGPHRDVLGELSEACRKRAIRAAPPIAWSTGSLWAMEGNSTATFTSP